MHLAEYFKDDDGDTLSMTAKYTKNAGDAFSIPGGIFKKPDEFQIDVP
jgi:hypothetical protein